MEITPLGSGQYGVEGLRFSKAENAKVPLFASYQNTKQQNPVYKEFNDLWEAGSEVMKRPMNEEELIKNGYVKRQIGNDGTFMYLNSKTRESVFVTEPQKPGDPIEYRYKNRSISNNMKFDQSGKLVGGEIIANGKTYKYQLDMEGKPFLIDCQVNELMTRNLQ